MDVREIPSVDTWEILGVDTWEICGRVRKLAARPDDGELVIIPQLSYTVESAHLDQGRHDPIASLPMTHQPSTPSTPSIPSTLG